MPENSDDRLYAPACDRNREPILEVLRRILTAPGMVLEVGSGTGQHAAYFPAHLPHLTWQATEVPDNLASIEAHRQAAALANAVSPKVLDLADPDEGIGTVQYVVSINTLHIVAWPLVESLFRLAGRLLADGGLLYCYGPCRYAKRELEPSNARFDAMLRSRDAHSGLRLFEDLDKLAAANGLVLAGDEPMPANNRSIWWRRQRADGV